MVVNLAIEGFKILTAPLIQPAFTQVVYLALASLSTILRLWLKGDRIQDENDLNNLIPETETWDFIVVGAGSAGGLVANRLSRNNFKVLLLETGGEMNPLQYVPASGLFMPNHPEVDWMHRSVPQKFASLNSVNQQSSWSTGKTLGGTGSLNLMIHLRGHKLDFDNWANITGDPSWSWDGVLPFFKSYEDYEVPGDFVNHGYGGDLRIETPDHTGPANWFVKAGEEIGYPNVDLNAPFTEGFDVIRYPIKGGRRQSSYKAFIEPVRTLPNLTIMKFAFVTKILFRDLNVAYGVEYDRHGKTKTAIASKEVIISAGTVGTPKILMLSGIGPRHDLEKLNIPVISDLPVGLNLQDHIGVYLGPFFINKKLSLSFERDITPASVVSWFTLGKGPATSTGCEAAGIFSSKVAKSNGEDNWPDIVYFLLSVMMFREGPAALSKSFSLKLDEITKYYQNAIDKDASHIIVQGARPFSRGFIKLGGSSPYDNPIIDPNYLGDEGEKDLLVLLEAVKKGVILMENTTSMGVDLGARFTDKKLPGCEHLEMRSDAYWICYIRRYSITLHHPVGTASMGSVVDTKLRVLGVKNLRVMDSSIQPTIVTTNTQASALMIGEKGVHMLMKHWKSENIDKLKYKAEKIGKFVKGTVLDKYEKLRRQEV